MSISSKLETDTHTHTHTHTHIHIHTHTQTHTHTVWKFFKSAFFLKEGKRRLLSLKIAY